MTSLLQCLPSPRSLLSVSWSQLTDARSSDSEEIFRSHESAVEDPDGLPISVEGVKASPKGDGSSESGTSVALFDLETAFEECLFRREIACNVVPGTGTEEDQDVYQDSPEGRLDFQSVHDQ